MNIKQDSFYNGKSLSISLCAIAIILVQVFPAGLQAQDWKSNGSYIWSNPTSKRIGVGTTVPSHRLTVSDNTREVQGRFYGAGGRGMIRLGLRGHLQFHIDVDNSYDRMLLGSGVFYDAGDNRYDATSNKAYDRAAIEFLNGGHIGFYTDTRNLSSDPYLTTSEWHDLERMRITAGGIMQMFPTDNVKEGGQIALLGAGSYNLWNLDNYEGWFRLHHTNRAHFLVRDDGQVQVRKYDGGDIALQLRRYYNGAEKGSLSFRIGTDGHAVLQKNSNNVMYFKGDRVQIGIGSDQPDARLAVYGNIKAREINCTSTNWSDFVFDDDYLLPTLSQVESFIEENGHLPEIPSAAEVEQNGVNLTEMQAKLLQKIEELTLYSIAQEKRLKALENQNNE